MSLEHSPARDGSSPAGRAKGEGSNQAPSAVDRIVGESECRQITNLSRTTRWRLMRNNLFPKKVSLSPNRRGWKISAVLAWLAEREAIR